MDKQWQSRIIEQYKHRPNDNRSPWQVDRSRIIHAAAFRRLQAKTQIMGIVFSARYWPSTLWPWWRNSAKLHDARSRWF